MTGRYGKMTKEVKTSFRKMMYYNLRHLKNKQFLLCRKISIIYKKFPWDIYQSHTKTRFLMKIVTY